jgi:hypothetical protein
MSEKPSTDKKRMARREIKALIRFYERRGWCWLGAVAYTAWRAM